ncbi:hypothetical protein ATK36_5000 [Amycolatopsis sulphurea]|uniref:Uncharacterized protein n=1 Tax=Amycolatopsis sulphurea TaxID=76022 RepID=A0A2A9FGC1_9PSEU|nr:hypothetical protein [Amycolatopsis sulphurea]PFG49816.1 hypothetical protein ATK36_5000 [Amycolatopsis sulphurea]
MFRFTKTDAATPTRRKTPRNVVCRVCGIVLLACLVLIVLVGQLFAAATWHPTSWLESPTVVTFGVAWLVKGAAQPKGR